MKIALISLNQQWKDKDANFSRCVDFVQQSHKFGCELVIFPEMTLTGYSLDTEAISEPIEDSNTLLRFSKLAKEYELSIIFGASLTKPSAVKSNNCLCLALANGDARVIYTKIHPFSFAGEDKAFSSGDRLGTMTIGELDFGASICYDLRFPEIYSAMSPTCNAGIIIACWPAKRIEHWRTLLVARAIENQFYMLGVNCTGIDGEKIIYEKSSLVVSPSGEVFSALYSNEEIDIYNIDLSETDRYRRQFPTVSDKRYRLYRDLMEHADTK